MISRRRSEAEWKKILSPEQFRVCRQGAVERPFTADYVGGPGAGIYRCAACGQGLFSADRQFDAGTGWPSFTEPLTSEALESSPMPFNGSLVRCRSCASHLGRLFNDGPAPMHRRYSIYSIALQLELSSSLTP